MVVVDRILSVLIIIAGIWHAVGSARFYHDELTLFWALCSSLFIVLFGAVSLLRASRPGDGALAWICLVSGIAWIVAALRFGALTGRLVDSHVLAVVVITAGICVFSVRSLMLART